MKEASVKESMSKKLLTVRWDSLVRDAAELMEERRIRHLPVVDGLGVVVGILSSHDVSRAMSPKNPSFLPGSKVEEYMNWPVITVDQNLSLKDAAQGMIDEKISAFVVTDKHKVAIGILTSEDLMRVLVSLLDNPTVLEKLSYSPVIGEFLRETQMAGI